MNEYEKYIDEVLWVITEKFRKDFPEALPYDFFEALLGVFLARYLGHTSKREEALKHLKSQADFVAEFFNKREKEHNGKR